MSAVPPSFRYHPNPLATGSVEESDVSCRRCPLRRGFIYRGPVYSIETLHDSLCPWCIADGSAATTFGAIFTDVGVGVPEDIPHEIAVEVAERTPGFAGWQQERWLFHCCDAAAFLGRAGYQDLQQHPDALEMMRQENAGIGWRVEEVEAYLQHLHVDGDATAYLFRCLHCGAHLAYSDMS